MIEAVAALAEEIRRSYLERPFGIAKFWGLSVLPPNDQSYQLVAVHADGDRLDLTFVHESRAGLASVHLDLPPGRITATWLHFGVDQAHALAAAELAHMRAARAADRSTRWMREE